MEKTNELTSEGYATEEEKVRAITGGFESLQQGEKSEFLGYILLKFGISRDMWYARLKGRTKWKRLEIDALKTTMEEKPWRNVR